MKREIHVAFSRRAQPIWFRVLKWIGIIWATRRYRQKPGFWAWMLGLLGVALGLHFFYRSKTKGWTHAWGGWNDPAFVEHGGPR